jgi:hypothetical protein
MKFSLARKDHVLCIAMRGDFDESLEGHLSALAPKIEESNVVFDAEHVELINSLGARHWIGFVVGLTKRQIGMTFERCSPAFVEACNLYPKFVPQKSMRSLLIPVDCRCSFQGTILMTDQQARMPDGYQKLSCPKCGAVPRCVIDPEDFLQSFRGQRG